MEILGKGQFACVNRGIWTKPDGEELEVAVKVLSEEADERDRIKFLQEAALMGQFTHTNVLTLHGVVTNEGNKVRNREKERRNESITCYFLYFYIFFSNIDYDSD